MAGGAKINVISQISAAVLASIRGAVSQLVTATFTLAEGVSDYFITALILQPTTGPGNAALELKPKGAAITAQIGLMSVDNETNYSIFEFGINDTTECEIVSAKHGTKAVLPVGIWLGSVHHVFGIDGSITPDGPIIFKSTAIFKSTEQTGNGAEQTIAHGLGRIPKIVIPSMTLALAGASTVLESTAADATNVYITATNTAKYKVWAL